MSVLAKDKKQNICGKRYVLSCGCEHIRGALHYKAAKNCACLSCIANLMLQYGAYLHQFWPQWEGTPLYLCICVFVFVYLRLSAVFCKVVAIWCILVGIDPRGRGRLCGPRLAPHAQPHSVLTLVTAFLLPFSFATLATVFSQIYTCLVLIYSIVFW